MSAVAVAVEPVLGSVTPRIATPPLVVGDPGPCICGVCPLSPETSYGFDVIDFARDILGTPLDPWQQYLVIHAGELLPDGRPRFRTVLLLVSRQVGKTFLGVVLTLYWVFVERQRLVLGTSTNRDTAKESWRAAVAVAEGNEWLAPEMKTVRAANGEETLPTVHGCRYRIAASNRRGGRGMTINRLILDELREHQTFEAVDAAVPATHAVPDAQIWALSNQGGDDSVVLRAWHDAAMTYIDTGLGDRRLGLFEWSAPPGADPTDVHALAQSCPAFGRRTDPEALLGMAIRAENAGGAELASFRCLDVATPILTSAGWASMGALAVGDRVIGTAGEWANVVNMSPIQHDKPCYRVTFNDKRTIVCDSEHLWTVKDRRQRRGWETLRTTDLIARGVTYHNPSMNYDVRNFQLPPVKPLDGPDVDLPIHPYLLGLWLGDGANHAALVFAEAQDAPHIRGMVESCGAVITKEVQDSPNCVRLAFQTGGARGHFTGALHDLAVYQNKHIPDIYFTGSLEQRLQLLQGLIDSDGTIAKRTGRCFFANTNDKLVSGVRSLVRSLGWKTSDLEPGQYGAAHHRPRFDVTFTPRPGQALPATLPRKLANIRAVKAPHRDVRPVTIASIEPVPSVPVKCIEVDTPDSLFLAGEFVPTHNTEIMCQKVALLAAAIDPDAWRDCGTDTPVDLATRRREVALCVDLALDGTHATLAAACVVDGAVHVEIVRHWEGRGCTRALREELPGVVARVKPGAIGWFPNGPAAAVAAELVERKGVAWPPQYVKLEEIRSDVTAVCMGLADLATARGVRHPRDPLLDAHIRTAQKAKRSDGWVFDRQDSDGPIDAVYAVAGATHLARTMQLRPAMRIVTRSRNERPAPAN